MIFCVSWISSNILDILGIQDMQDILDIQDILNILDIQDILDILDIPSFRRNSRLGPTCLWGCGQSQPNSNLNFIIRFGLEINLIMATLKL